MRVSGRLHPRATVSDLPMIVPTDIPTGRHPPGFQDDPCCCREFPYSQGFTAGDALEDSSPSSPHRSTDATAATSSRAPAGESLRIEQLRWSDGSDTGPVPLDDSPASAPSLSAPNAAAPNRQSPMRWGPHSISSDGQPAGAARGEASIMTADTGDQREWALERLSHMARSSSSVMVVRAEHAHMRRLH